MNTMQDTSQALDKDISFKRLLKFSFPTVFSMLFMSVYTMVDGIFVSRYVGENGLAAVNIIMPLLTIALALGTMFGVGGNALVAKLIGEKKEHEAKQIFTLIAIVAFAISLVITTLCLIFMNPLLRVLGANEDGLIALCTSYAMPIFSILPFIMFGTIFQTAFITVGKPLFAMIVSIFGGISNIILDYVFMGVLNWGISGAAIATGIGYAIPALVGIVYFTFFRKSSLHFVKPKLDWKALWISCSNGMSEMVTYLSSSVVTLLFNNIIMRMVGVTGVSAATIIMYTQSILTAIYMGYSTGIAPIISFNYGKQDTARLKKIYTISLIAIAVASITVFALSMGLANQLVSIFTPKGTELYSMAVAGFRIFSISLLFMGFNSFASAMFTALSNGKVSAILSFFRTLIFIVIALLVLPLIFDLTGVWLAIPIAEILGVLMTIYYFKKKKPVYGYGLVKL